MHDLEFYKEIYYKELERKEQINNKLNIVFSILVLVISGVFFCIKNISKFNEFEILRVTFYVSLTISLFMFVLTLVLIFNSFTKFKYGYLTLPSEIRKYTDQLANYHKDETKVKTSLNNYLLDNYISLTDNNIKQNDLKTDRVRYATNSLIITSFITLVTMIHFIPVYFKEDVTKIEIVNKVKTESGSNNLPIKIEGELYVK